MSSEEIKHFAYSVSHDLKNPSIAIHGLTRLLTRNCDELLDERGKHYCQQILRSSEQIASLVEMINIYMSTKETVLRLDTINLADLVVMIREEFAVPLNIRQIELIDSQPLPEIRADRIALLRVLRNLVDNALKYGGDSLTRIVVGYSENEDHHIISVSDDGVGLTEEESQDVFGSFYPPENSSRNCRHRAGTDHRKRDCRSARRKGLARNKYRPWHHLQRIDFKALIITRPVKKSPRSLWSIRDGSHTGQHQYRLVRKAKVFHLPG